MARTLALALRPTHRRFSVAAGRERSFARRLWSAARIPKEKFPPLAIAAFIAVTIAYLAQVTGVVLKGYEIRTLEERIETLRRETRQLELELAGVQAMANIAERVDDLGMVPVKDARYIKIVGSEVAIK
ncbi:MAG: hypothetical protein AAB562_01255 [Patescibacteria group bacterium]